VFKLFTTHQDQLIVSLRYINLFTSHSLSFLSFSCNNQRTSNNLTTNNLTTNNRNQYVCCSFSSPLFLGIFDTSSVLSIPSASSNMMGGWDCPSLHLQWSDDRFQPHSTVPAQLTATNSSPLPTQGHNFVNFPI